MNSPHIFILSGIREIGKTTLLLKLLDQARLLHLQAAGVISPPIFIEGQKIGIDLFDVKTGKQQNLAVLRHDESSGVTTDHWAFITESLNWGNEILSKSTPCDLLIIDELGPIELERGQGWQNGLSAIASGKYRVAVVVIRPELVPIAIRLWPEAQVLHINEKSDKEVNVILKSILACFTL